MDISILQTLVTTPVPRDTMAPWLSEKANKVALHQDFIFRVICEKHDIDTVIVVPKGYISDWSTIPRIMWWFYPPNYSEARRGAVAHDFLYSHLYWQYSKAFADDLLEAFMRHDNAHWLSRKIFRIAVGIGGKGGWYYRSIKNSDEHWRTYHEIIKYKTTDSTSYATTVSTRNVRKT